MIPTDRYATPLPIPLPPSGKGPGQLLPIPPIGIGRDGRIGRAGHHIERHPMPQGHEATRLPTRSGRGLPAPGFLPGHDVSGYSLALGVRPHPFAPSGDVMARGQEGPDVTGRWVSELGPAQSPRTIGSLGPVGWCDRECPDGAACCRGAAQAICKGCDDGPAGGKRPEGKPGAARAFIQRPANGARGHPVGFWGWPAVSGAPPGTVSEPGQGATGRDEYSRPV